VLRPERQNRGGWRSASVGCEGIRKALDQQRLNNPRGAKNKGETVEEILDALASSHFRSLRNYGDRWGISHLSFDGVSIAEIFGDHLDALLDTWVEVNKALEMHAEDNQRIAASETN